MFRETDLAEQGMPTVAIVGVGPRGLYCLEALSAAFTANPLRAGLHVAIFNKSTRFGTSPIYDPDQPPWLLSNGRAKEINGWGQDNSDTTGPAGSRFIHWNDTEFQPLAPADPEGFPPRAVVGQYLSDGFQRVAAGMPRGMRLSTFAAEVTDIVPGKDGYGLYFVDAEGRCGRLVAHKIVLTTGHSYVRLGRRERHYRDFAAKHPRASFIPYAYPVVDNLAGIPADACVAMKGIGLTFIDAVLALTEGRGGIFKRRADGQLRYQPSGQEPKTIFPFCHTGLPMAPKSWDYPSAVRPLTFVTSERLAGLQRRSGGKLDLKNDVWPLAELEMERQYYRTAMADQGDRRQLDECGADAGAMRQVIDRYLALHPELEPFNYDRILDPTGGRRFTTREEYNSFVEYYMQNEIDHARAGLVADPARAAVSMWYEIRATLKPFVAFGGLTPESHRLLIEYYFPLFKRVVFGPPLVNIEKVLALHRAGLLDFSVARNPRLITRRTTGRFELRTSSPPASAQVEVLVDARYPTVEILRDVTPLYQSLRRRGMIREFTNGPAGVAGSTYCTGAIDMTPHSQYVINQRGVANPDIAVYGTPTEGNLIATFNINRDGYPTVWAANVLEQLRIGAEQS